MDGRDDPKTFDDPQYSDHAPTFRNPNDVNRTPKQTDDSSHAAEMHRAKVKINIQKAIF